MIELKEPLESFEQNYERMVSNPNVTASQKAEMLRLKALYLIDNNVYKKVSQPLLQALKLSDHTKIWYLWQTFCFNGVVINQSFEWIIGWVQGLPNIFR